MIDFETCRNLALSFPDVTEQEHFAMPSFRFNKKIFMTFHLDKGMVMLKLPLFEQSIFSNANPEIIFPVKGYWGTRGATMFNISKVTKSIFKNALTSAYKDISSPQKSKSK